MSTATKRKRERRSDRRKARNLALTPDERKALDLAAQTIQAEPSCFACKEFKGENGSGKSLSPPIAAERMRRLSIAAIRVSKDNPRECPTQEGLAGLVDSIRAHGVVQPIIVRPTSEHDERLFVFEIVAGERRWRAAGLAGLQEIPAIVRVLDDRQAREVRALENLQREDLTPIEEARCYQALLCPKGPDAPTQEQLGKRLGVSQPQIAASLALLKLPKKWQERIASGEIPPTHARFLTPFRDRPQILQSIHEEIESVEGGIGSLQTFAATVYWAAKEATVEINGGDHKWDPRLHECIPRFTPTPEERKQLDVIEIRCGDGEPVEVACNVKLWHKLQDRFAKKFVAEKLAKRGKKAQKAEDNSAPGDSPGAEKSSPKKPPTGAKLKAQAEADRRWAEEATKRTARAVRQWRVDWLAKLIADRLGERLAAKDRERLLLYFAASDLYFAAGDCFPQNLSASRSKEIRGARHESLAKILRAAGGVLEKGDLWPAIVSKGDIDNVLSWLRARFWDAEEKGPVQEVPAIDVERIAAHLGVDPAAAWKADQKADIGEGFWNLHTKEQLLELGKELGVHFDAAEQKTAMIKRLMTAAKPLAMPRELAGEKRKRKKAMRPKLSSEGEVRYVD
jgi:ParB/RepB/Spo0J family partition protein